MAELKPRSSGNGYEQTITSNDVSSISDAREKVSISIPQQDSIGLTYEPGTSQSWQRPMQKVADFLRRQEHNKCDYDPAIVSFGPYHHGKAELKLAEDFKPKSLEFFVAGSGQDTDFYYIEVLKVIHKVRRCYVETSTDKYDDATFARMMLHDACFIINNIYLTFEFQTEAVDHLGWLGFRLILRDMFLLENQIPFWFLKLLFHLKYGENKTEEILANFMSYTFFGKYNKQTGESNKKEEEPLHLLEAFRRILVADCNDSHGVDTEKDEETKDSCRPDNYSFRSVSDLKDELESHGVDAEKDEETKDSCRPDNYSFRSVSDLKDELETNRWFILEWLSLQSARIGKACQRHCFSKFQWLWKRRKTNPGVDVDIVVHSFRSVTDLKAKGIHFKPSSTKSLKDIKFKSSYIYAELQLSIWFVSIYTKVFFLNMIAFEMCPKNQTDLTLSSYIIFMKSLIEYPEDVKELREKQILLNTLGSDEEVLQVYKDINAFESDNPFIFKEVKEKIQVHYNSKAKTWLAELIHTYFRSPWSAIALLAAVVLLCSTLVQTHFTVHPSSDK